MNIRDATLLAQAKNGWLMKRDRTDKWMLFVAPGSVYRDDQLREVSLDARDCRADDWYVVDDDGAEIAPPAEQKAL